jgi:hypothetical protein
MIGDMGAGYELRPVTIERSAGRRPIVLFLVASIVVGVVVLKPWTIVPAPAVEPAIVAPATVAVVPPPVPAPRVLSTQGPPVIGSLAAHSGTWGVGIAGIGPRYDGESWADWTAVDPWPASPTSERVATGPRAACSNLGTLYDGALFVAVTNPSDVPIDRSVRAWWWDGAEPTSLADTTRIVVPAGDAGISYLVRRDRAPWPAGRYELQLVAGDRAMAMGFCLTPH